MDSKYGNLYTEVVSKLQFYANTIDDYIDKDDYAKDKLTVDINNLLLSLAKIAPKSTPSKLISLKTNKDCNFAKHTLNNIYTNPTLEQELQDYIRQAEGVPIVEDKPQPKRHQYVDRTDAVERFHKANYDSSPHDMTRHLGDLIGTAIYEDHLYGSLAEYYSTETLQRKNKDTSNSYEDLLRSKYGNDSTIFKR